MSGGYGDYNFASSLPAGAANGFDIVTGENGLIHVRTSGSTGKATFDLDNVGITHANEDLFTVTGRWNSTTSRDIFVNGVWRDEGTAEVADPAVDRFVLGAGNNGANGWQDNLLLGAAVWSRALTDGEILSLYEDPWALITPRRKSYFWVAASGGAVGNAWYYNQQQQVVA